MAKPGPQSLQAVGMQTHLPGWFDAWQLTGPVMTCYDPRSCSWFSTFEFLRLSHFSTAGCVAGHALQKELSALSQDRKNWTYARLSEQSALLCTFSSNSLATVGHFRDSPATSLLLRVANVHHVGTLQALLHVQQDWTLVCKKRTIKRIEFSDTKKKQSDNN